MGAVQVAAPSAEGKAEGKKEEPTSNSGFWPLWAEIGQRVSVLFDDGTSHQPAATLETPQGQKDGFFSQLPFKWYLPEVASVGDSLKICPWVASRVGWDRIVVVDCLDVYRTSPDSGELQYKPRT